MSRIAILLSAIFICHLASADDPGTALSEETVNATARAAALAAVNGPSPLDPQTLIFSVVKITNKSATLFSAAPGESHGTGFFIGIDPVTEKGLIFTNKHVIAGHPMQVQRLTIEFNTLQMRGEVIVAKLIYQSRLHDFAVLEFDPRLLTRAHLEFPLRLPAADSPFLDFVANEKLLRGRLVMAIGNPFNGNNITTYGQVTGIHYDSVRGPFIQTQTPINPGNSGGPLISQDTGEAIGINTMTVTGADGTHYSIPIGILIEEFGTWKRQRDGGISPTIAQPRPLRIQVTGIGENQLRLMDMVSIIERAIPGYFHNFASVLSVSDAHPSIGLQKGDLLLSVDEIVLGGLPYNLLHAFQMAGPHAQVKVIRRGEVVDVDVDVRYTTYREKRNMVDYVYISGLLLQESSSALAWLRNPNVSSRVAVEALVNSAEVSFGGIMYPPPGSVLSAVSFGGEDFPIETLFDLKMAINQNRDQKFIVLRMHRANFMRQEGGEYVPLFSQMVGMPLVDGVLSTFVIPMREILTPFQFSMSQFKRQFGFGAEDAATWNWQDHKKADRLPSPCREAISRAKTQP